MNGIKMSDCEFYVDEEKRTVVCVIEDTEYMLLNFIEENFEFSDVSLSNTLLWSSLRNKLRMPKRFIGKAVCAPEDKWNEELGRKLAFSRAKGKCYRSFFKRANMFIHTLDRRINQAMTAFNDFGEKLEANRVALEEQINMELPQ